MVYDPDPAATHDPATGFVVPADWLDLINANFAEIGAAWNAYTPVWAATGAAPAIGNGVLAGAYKKLGKLLFLRLRFVAGSTTTFGGGEYSFSLPAGVSAIGGVEQVLAAKAYDASSTTNNVLTAFVVGGGTAVVAIYDGATALVGDSTPFVWAQNDNLHITGCIETN